MEPKVNKQAISVLAELLRDLGKPRYGLELSKEVGFRVTTVCDVLLRLEDAGWLSSEWESVAPLEIPPPRRRMYRLTTHGATAAQAAVHGVSEKAQSPAGSGHSINRGALEPSLRAVTND